MPNQEERMSLRCTAVCSIGWLGEPRRDAQCIDAEGHQGKHYMGLHGTNPPAHLTWADPDDYEVPDAR
jgi:hypothetical protein